MEMMLAVLCRESIRLEEKLRLAGKVTAKEKTDYAGRLEIVKSDINRLEQYIDRPSMQTFSELLFVDDIRLRVKQILAESEDQTDRPGSGLT